MTELIDGISEKALNEFLSEAQEIVESLNRDVLKLDDDLKREKRDPDLINNIFRGAHSLKGLSGMFGATRLSDLAHSLESLLDAIRLGRVEPSTEVIDALFDTLELFNRLIAESSGGPKVPKRALTAIGKQLDKATDSSQNRGEGDVLARLKVDPEVLSVLTEYEEYRLVDNVRQGMNLMMVHASFNLMSFDDGLAELSTELKTIGELVSTLPSSDPSSDQKIDFDIIIASRKNLEEVRKLLSFGGVDITLIEKGSARQIEEASSETEEDEEVDTSLESDTFSMRSVSQTVRVDIKKLDVLMNAVGELVLVRTAVQHLSEQLKSELGFTGLAVDLFKEARNFERKLNDLQAGIMDVRMVPLGQNLDKLARLVRRLSRLVGKEIQLRIKGADTELDKLIVEDLSDPLVHIIRNAVDHGIEPPEQREKLGKPRQGSIDINAYQKGNHVVIEISDDGRGIDLEKVKSKALDTGIVDSQRVDEMPAREAMNLLFMPGFSTSEEVSELSGRGVGLDVVKNNIAELSGMIDIESESGSGTKIVITLPITLAIIRALIIRVAERNYAVPLNSVIEIINIRTSRIRTIERREVIELRGATLPLIRLGRLFQLEPESHHQEGTIFVVVVGLAQNRLGVVVDDLVGQQDIVIKPLGESLAQVPGISGATSLADQQTILVLDVGAIIEESMAREQ